MPSFSMGESIFSSGQWLCGSVGCFQYQRSAVRIQSSAKIYLYLTFVSCQLCIEKTKIKKIEAGNGPFKKKYFQFNIRFLLVTNVDVLLKAVSQLLLTLLLILLFLNDQPWPYLFIVVIFKQYLCKNCRLLREDSNMDRQSIRW